MGRAKLSILDSEKLGEESERLEREIIKIIWSFELIGALAKNYTKNDFRRKRRRGKHA